MQDIHMNCKRKSELNCSVEAHLIPDLMHVSVMYF